MSLTRRNFLRFGLPAAAAIALAPQEIWTPKRTFFLPPRGGWRRDVLVEMRVTFPAPTAHWGRIVAIEVLDATPPDWQQSEDSYLELKRKILSDLPRFEDEYLCNWEPISTPEKGV